MAWIRRHPVAAFLAWFFPVGWAIAFIPLIAKNATGVEWGIEPFIILSTWFGLLLPVVVIVRLVDGPEGLDALRRKVLRIRASVGWYALALVVVPALSVLIAVGVYGLPDITASQWVEALVVGLLLQTVVGFLTTNLWEEVAWMGFVQARFQARYGVVLAVLITALLFMLQHVPLIV